MQQLTQRIIQVSHNSDVAAARQAATALATAIGFVEKDSYAITLAVSELATNLVKHAQGGMLTLTSLVEEGRVGLQITSQDSGPGIADAEQALTDGFSTVGSLGYGLGAVNRIMDTLDITSHPWRARSMLVLHSDGVTTRWRWQDFRHLAEAPVTVIARQLLRVLAQDTDDATGVVVKNAEGRATLL